MVFFGHKEALSPTEAIDIETFQNQASSDTNTSGAVSETTSTRQTSSSTTTSGYESRTLLEQTIPNGTVLEDFLHVRVGPGLEYTVITQLYKGDPVIIGENHNGWLELLLDGRIFYVSDEYISLSPSQQSQN